MTVQIHYELLRDEFVKIFNSRVTPEALEEIKNGYSLNIDSKRKLSSIKDLEKLIKVLEKYAVLRYDNIEAFHDIEKKYINTPYLQTKLKNYEDRLEKLKVPANYNMYLHDDIQPSTSDHDQETCDRTRVPNSLEEIQNNATQKSHCLYDKESKLKQLVIIKASELLGRSWRDVCRFMDLKEYQIDEIQDRYPYNLKEQSFQALQICILQYDSDWKINILHALEKGRRKDIKEVIEKIFLCGTT